MATIAFELDGRPVEAPDLGSNLLVALREHLGVRSVKDGCSPQGQCGCCTVLVDGAPRVACVTPLRRVAGRSVTTVDGLDAGRRDEWAASFCAHGASQCGFCTPGIIVRLEALRTKRGDQVDEPAVERALAAHLCRCTGWQTIIDAALGHAAPDAADRDLAAAGRRAAIEGGAVQLVDPRVALGRAGFADDTAPDDALVALPGSDGGWIVADSLVEAQALAAKVQGRRTTLPGGWPLEPPTGEWVATLRTTWVEPAYLEPDASWCAPGGEPASALANGGAFGGKSDTEVGAVARRLADEHGRPVRVLLPREATVRHGPKRPPVAGGIRADGSGELRVVRTPGIADAVAAVAPDLVVTEVDVAGPPTSASLRAAGWAEAILLRSALDPDGPVEVVDPDGRGRAVAELADGRIHVDVTGGEVLDEVVMRSYVVGAAHQALGWVTSEALAVDGDGEVHDLTIRSFGIVRPSDMWPVDVVVHHAPRQPTRVGEAAFLALAAAQSRKGGCPPSLPTELELP